MLKQISTKIKCDFLKAFTEELILNSKPKIEFIEGKPTEIKEKAEEQEVKKIFPTTFIKPKAPGITGKTQTEKGEFFPSILTLESVSAARATKPLTWQKTEITSKETLPERLILKQKLMEKGPLKPYTIPLSPESQKIQVRFTEPTIAQAYQSEREIDLGKLNVLLSDKKVTMIECPGPNKFVVVKKAGQINLTKITLTQEEIKEIVEKFSEKTRIPIIGGVFKVSSGNLTVVAIISEFVGSRFIIYKASPYSLLEKQEQY